MIVPVLVGGGPLALPDAAATGSSNGSASVSSATAESTCTISSGSWRLR